MAEGGLAPHEIKYALGKYVDKGEDAWMQQPAAECSLLGAAGANPYFAFYVYIFFGTVLHACSMQ